MCSLQIKKLSVPYKLKKGFWTIWESSHGYSLFETKFTLWKKCFLTILDDYSRYGWIIFCKSESEDFNIFLTWYNRIKNIFNKTIKYLHSNNGTEFINNKFNEFCNNMNGIIFEHNIPNNPTANYINNRIPRKGNDDSVFDFHLNTDNTDININNDNNIINNINNDNDINNYNNNMNNNNNNVNDLSNINNNIKIIL